MRPPQLKAPHPLAPPATHPQDEKAAAAAAAGVRDRDKTLVQLRSEGGVARGENMSLEKGYLRLTSLPRWVGVWRQLVGWLSGLRGGREREQTRLPRAPSSRHPPLHQLPRSAADVRPPEVLAQALQLVKARWTSGACEYAGPRGACDQLKAIRQDLTVQHVRSRFTVQVQHELVLAAGPAGAWRGGAGLAPPVCHKPAAPCCSHACCPASPPPTHPPTQVYETHARIAVEVADWAEFRQCHSVLQVGRRRLGWGWVGGGWEEPLLLDVTSQQLACRQAPGSSSAPTHPPTHRPPPLQSLYEEGLPGEQHEFTAYGLLLAAVTGRSGLAHELSDALAAAGSGLGAAIAQQQPGKSGGGGSSGWGAAGKRKKGKKGMSSPSSGSSPDGGSGPAAAAGSGGHAHADGATAGAAAVADDRYVPHALAACRAYLEGNVVRFLRLYEDAPRMAPYLMDALLAKLRARAYSAWHSRGCW